jgi:hypothetical protein
MHLTIFTTGQSASVLIVLDVGVQSKAGLTAFGQSMALALAGRPRPVSYLRSRRLPLLGPIHPTGSRPAMPRPGRVDGRAAAVAPTHNEGARRLSS